MGDHVYIQNLVGNHPKCRERTGVVVEVKQFHQYVVRIDGSGRVTLRKSKLDCDIVKVGKTELLRLNLHIFEIIIKHT